MEDKLYADPIGAIKGFTFDEDVVRVFPDMLRRSIPGYQTIITQTGLLAARYAKKNSNIYDLGCSLGTTSLSILQQIDEIECCVLAIDNSEAMSQQCKYNLQAYVGNTEVLCLCADITGVPIKNASVVAMNFTLQFIPPERRFALMNKIYSGLQPGGAFIISEKIGFDDQEQEALHTDMYHAFKQANGYSKLEISQKRTALENVLITDSLPQHIDRITKSGFKSVEVWFQCFNFVSMIALK